MVADEADLALRPGKREVIGGMTGGCHRLHSPACTLDEIAVLHLDIGPEITVSAGFRIVLLALEAGPRRPMRTLCIDGSAGRLLDPAGVGRMVAMGVGDEDVGDGLPAHGVEQRFRMRLTVRTGIDDGDLILSEDVA